MKHIMEYDPLDYSPKEKDYVGINGWSVQVFIPIIEFLIH
jgi:hypothetical protein